MANELLPPPDDDLLFEQSYLLDILPAQDPMVLSGLEDPAKNLPAALASAAYGYTRGGQFSPFNAAIFGFFGYSYPLISTLLFAVDAVFIQDTPAKKAAAALYSRHSPALKTRMGLSGLGGGDRKRCVKFKAVKVRGLGKVRRCVKYAR